MQFQDFKNWTLEETKDFRQRKNLQAYKVLQNITMKILETFEKGNQKIAATISTVPGIQIFTIKIICRIECFSHSDINSKLVFSIIGSAKCRSKVTAGITLFIKFICRTFYFAKRLCLGRRQEEEIFVHKSSEKLEYFGGFSRIKLKLI